MPSTGPTTRICEWACTTRYDDVPAEVREEALRIVCDVVGGMVAGATLDSCAAVVEFVRQIGGQPECSVIGHPLRVPLLNAVMANGCIGHADEVDPTSVHGAGHFAATMVPTALTMGQYVHASGRQFMHAFILGAEIAARMQSVVNTHRDVRPQFYYSAGAQLGAAVTAALMVNLDADRMEHALGIAAMGSAPLMSLHHEERHQIKGLAYSGRTARSGVESALLARAGLHGPREVLTTESGFFHAFVGAREAGHEVVEGLGSTYLMKDLLYKRYSTGGPNLAPLHAFLQMMEHYKFSGDDIAEIVVAGIRPEGAGVTDHHPSIHTETVLSLAACYGEYTFRHAHDLSYCEDPRFVAFRKRVRMTLIPREGKSLRRHRLESDLTVRTRDGREFKEAINYPLMTPAELEQKFRALVALRVDETRAFELERKLKTIEQSADVGDLVRDLEIGY